MTNDDFTEAARAEAERYFADPGVDPLTLSVIDHAMHLAEWARTYLAAQEPTDAEVEAAALVICIEMDGPDGPPETKACKGCVITARRAFRAAARAARLDEENR